ncbi:MAG: prolyl oligopeptidase family serine peptidase, partial [candidate division WOR-3 bacterium]
RITGIEAMKDIPVWAFHGAEDDIVPPEETEKMVEALRRVGGRVRYSRLDGQGHSIHKIYEHEKIYEWLLRHRK